MRTPNASSTSALPQRLETERLPCLATAAPAAAATKAAAVEMLNVLAPSPPVPHVSTSGVRRGVILAAFSRITRAQPAISSTVSPLIRSAVMNAAIWAGVASPSMMASIAAAASSSVRCTPSTALRIAS